MTGQPDQIGAYTVVGLTRWRSPLALHGQRPLSRFVGRARELATLLDILGQVEQSRRQVVGLMGDPGVGKSRVCYEFMRALRTRDWLMLETGAASYGKATPYRPVIDLLRAYFEIEDRDDGQRRGEKITNKLHTLDTALGPTLPAFLTLLDVPFDDQHWQALDPPQRRQRTLDAIRRLLLRESQVRPLFLIFEDPQWIDGETQAVLDSLIESLPAARILLLVSYRPEYQHGWGRKTYYTQLRLDPLPPEHARDLLDALLGDDSSLEPLAQRLIAWTEGNPFFLEESVRTLMETHVLVGDLGTYRLAKLLPSMQVAATVQTVVAARIDRLSVEAKCLLQAAAVIGKDVSFALLRAIAELPDEGLRRSLASLQAAEFLYEKSLFSELAYTFKHALTQEVAYGSLPPERRRALRTQLMEAIETRYADRIGEHIEYLAHQAFRGEVWEKAAAYLRQAGGKAVARSANRDAVVYLEQALVALQHLPESRNTLEQAIDLRLDLRNALHPFGQHERVHDYLCEAKTIAESLGDRRRLAWVSSCLGHYFRLMGDQEHTIECLQRALAIALEVGDCLLQVDTNFVLGEAHLALAKYPQAMRYLRRVIEFVPGERAHQHFGFPAPPGVVARQFLAICLAELGAFAEGLAIAEEGIRIAEAVDHPFTLIQIYDAVSRLYLLKGDLDRAIPILERAVEFCRVWDIRSSFPGLASTLGSAYAMTGRITEALPLLEQAVERATSMKRWVSLSRCVVRLSEAYLLDGRLDDAGSLAQHTLVFAREHKERGHEAWALRLLGEIAAHRDPPDAEQAEASYQHALALAEELGMRPLLAHCHRGLGALYRQIGRLPQARAELSAAIELLWSMEMTFWLPRAEAEQSQSAISRPIEAA